MKTSLSNFFKKAHHGSDSALDKVAANEIILEFDNDDREVNNKLIEKSIVKLEKAGINFRRQGHNGKSDYLVWCVRGLNEQEQKLRSNFKKLMLITYGGEENNADLSFAAPNQLKPRLNQVHWKKQLAEKGEEKEKYPLSKYQDYTEHKVIRSWGNHEDNDLNSHYCKTILEQAGRGLRQTKKRMLDQREYTLVESDMLKIIKKDGLKIFDQDEKGYNVENPFHATVNNNQTSFKVWKDSATWTDWKTGSSGGIVSYLAIRHGMKTIKNFEDEKLTADELTKICTLCRTQYDIDLKDITEDWKYILAKGGDNIQPTIDKLYNINPFHTNDLGKIMWWDLEELTYRELPSKTNLMFELEKIYGKSGMTLTPSNINRLQESILRFGLTKRPKSLDIHELATMSGIYSFTTGEKVSELNEETWTETIIPHKVGMYADKTKFPTINKLIVDWSKNDNHEKAKVMEQMLYEVMAFTLFNHYAIQKIIILVGTGGQGKGTYLRLLNRLIGLKNIKPVSVHQLSKGDTSGFNIIQTKGRLLIPIDEAQIEELKNTDTIKKMTGNDLLTGRRPYDQATVEWYNKGKLVMTTNDLPRASDESVGYLRRLQFLVFENPVFEKSNKSPDQLISEIPEEEFENLLRYLINVGTELWKTKRFCDHKTIDEIKEINKKLSNSFHWWFDKKVIPSNTSEHIPIKDLWTEYKKDIDKHNEVSGESLLVLPKVKCTKWLRNSGHDVGAAHFDVLGTLNSLKYHEWKGKETKEDEVVY